MYTDHVARVRSLQAQLEANRARNLPIRIQRSATNSTREQGDVGEEILKLDFTAFTQVLYIDTERNYVDVEPGVSMDVLLDATLALQRMPEVVPEFPGITAGGAAQGGALESSSFRYGQFNDRVLEYELLLADGTIVIARPDNEYADLYWGVATSYGSLALITRMRLRLIEAKPYVRIQVQVHASGGQAASELFAKAETGHADFLEGIIYGPHEAVTITGTFVEEPQAIVARFLRNIDPWYYRFIRVRAMASSATAVIPIRDYLFRYDKGAFWMGEYLFPIFHLRSNALTRFFFAPFLRTRKLYDGLHALNLRKEFVIQDFYVSRAHVPDVLALNAQELGIYPVWLCPIRSTPAPQKLSSHYRPEETMLLNIGIYGKPRAIHAIDATRKLESLIASTHERKMLYAQTYWGSTQFWELYDHVWYQTLREKYAARLLPDLWTKVHSSAHIEKPRIARGVTQLLLESLRGKNVHWK